MDDLHVDRAIELARKARADGNRPYGAVLVGANGEVLAEGRNAALTSGDVTAHAESAALRAAGTRFGLPALIGATMYSSGEPCPMCATAMYLAGIARVVFAYAAAEMRPLGHPRDPFLPLACRDVVAAGARPVIVEGPVRRNPALMFT